MCFHPTFPFNSHVILSSRMTLKSVKCHFKIWFLYNRLYFYIRDYAILWYFKNITIKWCDFFLFGKLCCGTWKVGCRSFLKEMFFSGKKCIEYEKIIIYIYIYIYIFVLVWLSMLTYTFHYINNGFKIRKNIIELNFKTIYNESCILWFLKWP